MPERSSYIPGVPCWVDSNQPDPQAALPFYSGLFGWEFENAMPPEAGGEYHMARIRGGDVAAISVGAARASADGDVEHVRRGGERRRRRPRRSAPRAARCSRVRST